MKIFIFFITFFFISGVRADPPLLTITLKRPDHDVSFRVEVAHTPHELERGLMHRTSLAPDGGMLFIFPKPQKVTFWMKETYFPLDLLFIHENGKIIQLYKEAQPFSLQLIRAHQPVKYVLELPGGSINAHAIQWGDNYIQGENIK